MTPTAHQILATELMNRWPESHPQPSLERIQALCTLMGDPQQAAPVIQLTGTNGKGSTAIMIEALLRAQGLRTGRFSSPHLVNVTERICIDGEAIADRAFDQIWEEIAPLVAMVDDQLIGGVPMTFFEVMTGMAYAAFADAPVDVMIMEVGMGGRWDATSVADPAVSVICPIDLDHTHLLGSTIVEIAAEKAGIIRPGGIAVCAGQPREVAEVLVARCAEVGVPMLREGMEFSLVDRQPGFGGQLVRVETAGGSLGGIFLPLLGAHMAHNAVLAIAASEALHGCRGLDPKVIEEGLGTVVAPARLESVSTDPLIVIDTAHNPHGVRATLTAFAESIAARPVIAVVAMMRDKSVAQVMDLLADAVDQIVVTTMMANPRAMSVADLAELAAEAFGEARVHQTADSTSAVELATARAGDEGAVLVIGSVYLAGEVRQLFVDSISAEPRDLGVLTELPE